ADRASKTLRNKNPRRSQPIGMNVEKPENFRLRKSTRVQDCAGFQSTIFAEFDHHLHTECPFAPSVAWRHSKLRVEFVPNRSNWTVAHHRQRSAQVHARRETCLGMPLK